MSLDCFLNMVSGLGMFLYGMKLLSDTLGDFAADRIKATLQKATSTPVRGVFLGACVTGIIQSSTATTLMVMGLVNAGSLNVYNALPVIMGANIGTTVTGQLLSFADINKENLIFSLIKPSGVAPFFILAGAVEKLFLREKENKPCADIFIGLGILFLGMEITEHSIRPLSDFEAFCNMMLIFRNPLLSLIVGALMTAVIQSSSVTIGILQTLATTNALSISSAIPIILGMNIGKVLPEFITTLGATKNTARTIFSDLTVNSCGVAVAFILFLIINSIFDKELMAITATRSMIANFHSVFNIVTTAVLLPFYKRFINLSKKIIR